MTTEPEEIEGIVFHLVIPSREPVLPDTSETLCGLTIGHTNLRKLPSLRGVGLVYNTSLWASEMIAPHQCPWCRLAEKGEARP